MYYISIKDEMDNRMVEVVEGTTPAAADYVKQFEVLFPPAEDREFEPEYDVVIYPVEVENISLRELNIWAEKMTEEEFRDEFCGGEYERSI